MSAPLAVVLPQAPPEAPGLDEEVGEHQLWADGADGLRGFDPLLDGAAAIADGDWVEAGLTLGLVGVDVAAVVTDPLGSLGGMAAEWALEHCQPFQDLLDELLGDDEAVVTAAGSWRSVGSCLAGVGETYGAQVRADLAGQHGLALTSYRLTAARARTLLRQLSQASGLVAEGIVLAGSVLGSVRTFVQAALADAIGKVGAAFAKTAASGGLLAPEAGTRLAIQVAKLVKDCRDLVVHLRSSLTALGRLIGEVTGAMRATATQVRTLFDQPSRRFLVEPGLELGLQHHTLGEA